MRRPQPLLTHQVEGHGWPVVLLNGGLMTYRTWDLVAAGLASKFMVVRCDFRGQLLSPGDPPDTLEGHAADIVRLLDHLGLERASLVGTSFGALIGLTMAAQWPARVQSLVAMTATDRATPEMQREGRVLATACLAAVDGGDRGAVFDLVAAGTYSPAYRERHAAELAQRRQAVTGLPATWFGQLSQLLRALDGLDLRPLLPRVVCPTFVLAGECDKTFPPEHSEALAAALPNAELQIVPGAAHGLVLEEPEIVTGSILGFLERTGGIPGGH